MDRIHNRGFRRNIRGGWRRSPHWGPHQISRGRYDAPLRSAVLAARDHQRIAGLRERTETVWASPHEVEELEDEIEFIERESERRERLLEELDAERDLRRRFTEGLANVPESLTELETVEQDEADAEIETEGQREEEERYHERQERREARQRFRTLTGSTLPRPNPPGEPLFSELYEQEQAATNAGDLEEANQVTRMIEHLATELETEIREYEDEYGPATDCEDLARSSSTTSIDTEDLIARQEAALE